MLMVVPGKPFFFTAPSGSTVTIVSVSHGAGPNVPAFRYAGQALVVNPVDAGQGRSLPGAVLTIEQGRKRLSALAPFATNPPKGEFFFYERVSDGQNLSLSLIGSVLPDDPAIAWTIEGL